MTVHRIIFSAIQPTGVPHIGNYAGALRHWVQLQRSPESDTRLIFPIADLHAITTPQPREQLQKNRTITLAAMLALGIDPSRCILYYQSSVSAHSELAWILACTASIGYLSRMTQWKAKLNMHSTSLQNSQPFTSRLKLGLFAYPVLQAADILVHRATHVPVGQDQQQHLEFARECVTNFNNSYGQLLVHPETMIPPVCRIMSLTDPTRKMSKSDERGRSRILITDTPDDIRKKISMAVSDSIPGISYDMTSRPAISNLLNILSVFDTYQRTPTQLAQELRETRIQDLKVMVSDAIIHGLDGVRSRFLDLCGSDNPVLDRIQAHGARTARQSAEKTMHLVKDAIGI